MCVIESCGKWNLNAPAIRGVPAVAVICCVCVYCSCSSVPHTHIACTHFIFFFITFSPFLPNRSRALSLLRVYYLYIPFPFFSIFFQSLFLSRVSRQTDHVVNLAFLFLCVVAPLPSSSLSFVHCMWLSLSANDRNILQTPQPLSIVCAL